MLNSFIYIFFFFFSSRRRHTRFDCDWSSDVCSSDLSMAPFDVFAAQDGWFVIAVGSDALFRKLCSLLQLPELAEDARFAGNALRCEHQAELKAALEARLRDSPRAH